MKPFDPTKPVQLEVERTVNERLRGHLESIADAFGCECGDQARAALNPEGET